MLALLCLRLRTEAKLCFAVWVFANRSALNQAKRSGQLAANIEGEKLGA